MIGYADSNKSTGVVASRWLLRQAQEAMVAACESAGVELQVFHGRGGAMGRGGRRGGLVRSMPPGPCAGSSGSPSRARASMTATGCDRSPSGPSSRACTASRSPPRACAARTAPRRAGAMPCHAWPRRVVPPTGRWCTMSRRSSTISSAVTPVDVIERAQIGSRPVSRADGQGVEATAGHPLDRVLVAEPAHASRLVRRRNRPRGH